MIDYHVHTSLCGHAHGDVEEYIQAAIDAGLSEIGFTDHAPLPAGLREGITMEPGEMKTYLGMIAAAKENFRDRIKVKLGLEVDFPLFDSFDHRSLDDPRMDYLIGSCHFLDDWPFDHPDHVEKFSTRDINRVYEDYYDIMRSLVSSGLFQVTGHFDLVKKFGHRATVDFSGTIEEIASLMAANNVAAEINTAGFRKPVKEIYPSEEIISIFFNKNVPVTLGSDAHSPVEISHMFGEAIEIIKKAGYRKISGFEKKQRYDIPL